MELYHILIIFENMKFVKVMRSLLFFINLFINILLLYLLYHKIINFSYLNMLLVYVFNDVNQIN